MSLSLTLFFARVKEAGIRQLLMAEMGYLLLVLVLGCDVLVPIKNFLTAKLHNKSFKSHIHVTYSHHSFAHMVYLANNNAYFGLYCDE